MTEISTSEAISQSRRRLVLLALLFFGPIIVSWLFIRFGSDRVELQSMTYGELVNPVVTLEAFQLPDNGVGLTSLQGIWTLLYPVRGECLESCEQLLHDTRQVRTALAKEMPRVQRVVLWQNSEQGAELPIDDPARHPALRTFRGDELELAPLWQQLPGTPEESLYLIDPMGNVMMRYPLDFEGKPLLKELNFLLKNSVLG